MKQNEPTQPGGPSRKETAAPNKRNVITLVSLIALIELLLTFQKWRRKHHKNLELIVSETPPTSRTRGESVTSTGRNLTVILWSELRARENRCREISRKRE